MARKTAIVTGGAKRVGKEIVLLLSRIGYDIVLLYYRSEVEAKETSEEVKRNGRRCEIYSYDLSNVEGIPSFFQQLYEKIEGELQLLVNNASIFKRNRLQETSPEALQKLYAVNFMAPYILSGCFFHHAKQPASIINILDSKAVKNGSQYSAYTLSKRSLLELTKQSAVEFAPFVRVNGIAPGLILPQDGTQIGTDLNAFQRMAENTLLKRGGEVKELLLAIEFLLENQYVTGQILFIDGGQHAVRGER